jgi:hypothetical protein
LSRSADTVRTDGGHAEGGDAGVTAGGAVCGELLEVGLGFGEVRSGGRLSYSSGRDGEREEADEEEGGR